MTPAERDLYVRTLIGEAGNQPADGQAAVAHVIRNRLLSGQFGGNLNSVMTAPKQFSTWNPGNPAGIMARNVPTDSPQYQRLGQIIDSVHGGQIPDPTNGATHFYNPTIANPGWGAGMSNSRQLGDHLFGNVGAVSRPVSNDQTGASIDEYFEGNAKRQGFTNHKFEGSLLRFLNENPYGVGISSLDRSNEHQAALYAKAQAKYGANANQWVAPPGRSNHNRGVAADLSYEDDNARKWAHENAPKYGLAFPLGNEAWHVEPADARGAAQPVVASGSQTQPSVTATSAPVSTDAAPMSMAPNAPDQNQGPNLGSIFASLMGQSAGGVTQPSHASSAQLPADLFTIQNRGPASGMAPAKPPEMQSPLDEDPYQMAGMTGLLGMPQVPGRPATRLT
jgi:hypothetical protein